MDVRPVVFAVMTLAAAPAVAAPFVAGDPQPISVRVAASRAAVVATPAANDGRDGGWSVAAVLHDATGTVRVGSVILPKPAPAPGTGQALLLAGGDRTVEVVPLSPKAAEYVATLPAPDAPSKERLAFALSHFDQADKVVRGDSFAELARLVAADFERHRQLLPRDRLRAAVDDTETPGDRLGLYAYLLGLCGDESDTARLRRRLLASDGFATGADGIAAGYLLVAGERGLADLETQVLARGETSPLLAAAVLEALGYFRVERPDAFRKDRLRRAACAGLLRLDAADLVVGYLAAGREWAALPDVVALLEVEDENPDRRRAAHVAAVRFLQECRRDTDAPVTVRSAADRALSRIAVNDSDLVRRATMLSGGPDERR